MFGGTGDDTILGGAGNDQMHGDAGNDHIFGEAGHDQLWGGAGADWFVFKGAGALDGGDIIEDYEDGVDRIVLEKLGVTAYKVGGAAGTVYAHDLSNGDVSVDVTTSAGVKFSIQVADPHHTLSAANFSAADFVFA
jgi:Ca2+-binding RTX toxin-like protein